MTENVYAGRSVWYRNGQQVLGIVSPVYRKIVKFDGNLFHFTMGFKGTRHSDVFFYRACGLENAPHWTRAFLGFLGFSLPSTVSKTSIKPPLQSWESSLIDAALGGVRIKRDPDTAPSPLPHKSTPLVSSMVEQSKMKEEPYEKG